MEDLLRLLVDPVPLLFVLFGVLFLARGGGRTRALGIVALALFWLAAAPSSAGWLREAWTVPDSRDPARRYHAVVPLAGMIDLERARTPVFGMHDIEAGLLFNDNVERLLVAVAMLRQGAAGRLFYADVQVDGIAEAVTVARLLARMEVPADALQRYGVVHSTRDEARALASTLAASPDATVLLVTSELHMRRALATVRAQGIRADGVSVGQPPPPLKPVLPVAGLLPTVSGLASTRELLYELVGYSVYALRGDL